VPNENAEINECWISDRDRFSYEGLNSPDRLTEPMIKIDGSWEEVDWAVALDHIKEKFSTLNADPNRIGAFSTPQATTEELYLFQKFIRELGSENVDYRLRQADCSNTGANALPWLGMSIGDVEKLDSILVIGSNIRKEQPLLAHRIRKAVNQNSASLALINPMRTDTLLTSAQEFTVSPSRVPIFMQQIVKAVSVQLGVEIPAAINHINVEPDAQKVADMLVAGKNKLILIGALSRHHPDRSKIEKISHILGDLVDAKIGLLSDGPNSLGAEATKNIPARSGLTAREMTANALDVYFLLHAEMGEDSCDPDVAIDALKSAKLVVAMSAFKDEVSNYATVMLPISPFSETSGTFINMEGKRQQFGPVAPAKGQSRPAWRLIAALGKLFGFSGFEYESIEKVREALRSVYDDLDANLRKKIDINEMPDALRPIEGIERFADVPMYSVDAVVRRAPALQSTKEAIRDYLWLGSDLSKELGAVNGDVVRVEQDGKHIELPAQIDVSLAGSVVRVPMTSNASKVIGGIGGPVQITKVASFEANV
jgi:NADH-quinone oxidoreductase subunit G